MEKALLSDFWKAFSAAIDETKELRITHVIDKFDAELGPHFFPNAKTIQPAQMPVLRRRAAGLKLGRNGGFIGCSTIPIAVTTTLRVVTGDEDEDEVFTGPRNRHRPGNGPAGLDRGDHSASTFSVGAVQFEGKPKPVTVYGMPPSDIDLELAPTLLSLPRARRDRTESGDMIVAGVGRFGPGLKVATAT